LGNSVFLRDSDMIYRSYFTQRPSRVHSKHLREDGITPVDLEED
jgi:hypothetical protein